LLQDLQNKVELEDHKNKEQDVQVRLEDLMQAMNLR